MRFIFSFVVVCYTSFVPLISSARDELAPCSHVDLRGKLQEIGWPRAAHLGARSSSLSIALSEAISFKLKAAITPLEIDRMFARGDSTERVLSTLSKTGACPLSQGPMDDVVFSRALMSPGKKLALPPVGCDAHSDRRLPPLKLELTKLSIDDFNAVDAALNSDRVLIVNWTTPNGPLDSTIEARRFSAEKDRCEWLVRMMNGPFCDSAIEGICEDGGIWISREGMMKKIRSATEIR